MSTAAAVPSPESSPESLVESLVGGFHLHVPRGQASTLQVDLKRGLISFETLVSGASPTDPETSHESGDHPWPDQVEDLLRRHAAYQRLSRSRDLVTAIVERDGWTALPPSGAGTYVRCIYTGGKREAAVYVRSETLIVKGTLRDRCIDMPGAQPATKDVHFRHSGANSSWGNTMAVVEAAEAYANDQ